MKLINDVITLLIDPNLYYSRLSFFESGREAINIKYQKSKRQSNGMNKFFTRSALVSQLIPNPSEGKVRALFGTGNISSNAQDSTMSSKQRNVFRSQQSGKFKSEYIDFESSNHPTNVESTMRY